MAFYIRDREQAENILTAWNECKGCDKCILSGPGWRCGHMAEQAQKYIEKEERKNAEG